MLLAVMHALDYLIFCVLVINPTDGEKMHPMAARSTQHSDSRFEKDVLKLTTNLNTLKEVLYVIFTRGFCKFNERFDATSEQCSCSPGYGNEDCSISTTACGATIPICANSAICVEEKGICLCNNDWDGVDCATPAKCGPDTCPYQRCLASDTGFLCEDSLPLMVQLMTSRGCTNGSKCSVNEECRNGQCVCVRGTVIQDGLCDIGLITCFNQEDCTAVSSDLVCRDETFPLTNRFVYRGRGPYCLCFDDKRIDLETGFCTSTSPQYSRLISPFKQLGLGDTYWPFFAAIGVIALLAGIIIYKTKLARGNSDAISRVLRPSMSSDSGATDRKRFKSLESTHENTLEEVGGLNEQLEQQSSNKSEDIKPVESIRIPAEPSGYSVGVAPHIQTPQPSVQEMPQNIPSSHPLEPDFHLELSDYSVPRMVITSDQSVYLPPLKD